MSVEEEMNKIYSESKFLIKINKEFAEKLIEFLNKEYSPISPYQIWDLKHLKWKDKKIKVC